MPRKSTADRARQAAYRKRFTWCQYTQALQAFGAAGVPYRWAHCDPPRKGQSTELELDHIYGRKGPCEQWCNYMMAAPVVHAWKTDNTTLGRIVALWFKLQAERSHLDGGENRKHFDHDAMRAIWGKSPMGMLEVWRDTVELPMWAVRMIDDSLETYDVLCAIG